MHLHLYALFQIIVAYCISHVTLYYCIPHVTLYYYIPMLFFTHEDMTRTAEDAGRRVRGV